MTARERVRRQIEHTETDLIPYTLEFEEKFDRSIQHGALERVNSWYGGDWWQSMLDNHIVRIPTANLGVDCESDKAIFDNKGRVLL